MRVLLLADKKVGLEILKFMDEKYKGEIAIVFVTRKNEIYNEAIRRGVPVEVFDPETINKIIKEQIDLGILAWWPSIIKHNLLNIPKLGFINTHPSLLPYNRGKNYNFWAIVDECPFGVTLHFADEGIDTGPIVFQERIDFDWTDTGGTLFKKAQSATIRLFRNSYAKIRLGQYTAMRQESSKGTFHKSGEMEKKSQIDLDGVYRARDLINTLRARTFPGYPGCTFEEFGEQYEVKISIHRISHKR